MPVLWLLQSWFDLDNVEAKLRIVDLCLIRHGEVYVLDDGGEVDLDLGNYERYLNITLTRENNITTGKIYQHVIEREVCASFH